MSIKSAKWVVCVFTKETHELIATRALRAEKVCTVLGAAVEDLPEAPYLLSPKEALKLQPYLPKPIDCHQFCYILEGREVSSFWVHETIGMLI